MTPIFKNEIDITKQKDCLKKGGGEWLKSLTESERVKLLGLNGALQFKNGGDFLLSLRGYSGDVMGTRLKNVVTDEKNSGKISLKSTQGGDEKIDWSKFDRNKIISKKQFESLRNFANEYDIELRGFKGFDGDIVVAKDIIRILVQLREKFPTVADKRHRLSLGWSWTMDADDFAVTKGRVITLNAAAFRNIEQLEEEYQNLVNDGGFVKGTDWRAIIHHEFGHVVAHTYNIKSLQIACSVTNMGVRKTLTYLKKCLSEYAFSFEDGSEILSEVFSDISSKKPDDFSIRFYQEILKNIQ